MLSCVAVVIKILNLPSRLVIFLIRLVSLGIILLNVSYFLGLGGSKLSFVLLFILEIILFVAILGFSVKKLRETQSSIRTNSS